MKNKKMHFLADVNIGRSIIQFLHKENYACQSIIDIDRLMEDEQITEYAIKNNYTILTSDKDFIRISQKYDTLRVIVFIDYFQNNKNKINALGNFLQSNDNKDIGCILLECN